REASDYLLSRNFVTSNYKTISRVVEDLELEKNLDVVVEGIRIVEIQKNKRDYETVFWNYSWISSFQRSLTSIRNALYILVALVTG
ncbi:hypothetical protein, partial [Enterococcus faecalis]